jgi:predicted transcriptional regulator of viral defense system
VLSHSSAFVFHGITEDFPSDLTATVTNVLAHELLPLGTLSNDWDGVLLPAARRPETIRGRSVKWVTVNPARFWGFGIFQPSGYPMRVTTLERTLIDGLQTPELCGGIAKVFEAWANSRDVMNVEALVGQVERLDIGILRQRVGYILDTLNLNHPQLMQWREGSQRGGSSRMVASAPFSPEYNQRWNLSLNAPVHLLRQAS